MTKLISMFWVATLVIWAWWLVPATQAQTDVLSGQYACSGTDLDGSTYQTTLEITVRGSAMLLIWQTEPQAVGLGILHQGVLSAAFRDRAGTITGIVVYDVRGQTLDGRWTEFSAPPGQLMTERCTRPNTKPVGV